MHMNNSSNCCTFFHAGAIYKLIWAFDRFVREIVIKKSSGTRLLTACNLDWAETWRSALPLHNWDISYLPKPLNLVNWSSALFNIKSCSLFTYFFISAQIGHGTRGARAKKYKKKNQLRKCVDFVTPCYTFYCTKHNKAKTWLSRLNLWKKLFFLSCSQFVVCQTLTPRLKAAFNWLINRWRSCVKIIHFWCKTGVVYKLRACWKLIFKLVLFSLTFVRFRFVGCKFHISLISCS